MHLFWFALRSLQIVGGALAVGFGPASSYSHSIICSDADQDKTKGDFGYV